MESGAIGRVIHMEASYLQSWLSSTCWGDWRKQPGFLWRLSKAYGSHGVLGDIGVHILDFASYAAGDITRVECRLKTYDKAKGNRVRGYTLDACDSAVIGVELGNGAIGTVHTSRWATGHVNSLLLRVFGDRGGIVVDLDRGYNELQICRGRDIHAPKWRRVRCPKTPDLHRRFIKSIRTGENDQGRCDPEGHGRLPEVGSGRARGSRVAPSAWTGCKRTQWSRTLSPSGRSQRLPTVRPLNSKAAPRGAVSGFRQYRGRTGPAIPQALGPASQAPDRGMRSRGAAG